MADFVDPVITQEIVDAKNKLVTEANRAETIVDEWEATGNLVKDAPADNKLYGRKNSIWEELNVSGTGDMTQAVYDPQDVGSDAFARSNHTGTQGIETVLGLNEELNDKLEDAPNDGKQYARQNAVWTEVAAGGSGNTREETLQTLAGILGTDSFFANQDSTHTVYGRGYYKVSATGTNQGNMPKKGKYRLLVADTEPTLELVGGIPVHIPTVRLEALLYEKDATEGNNVIGVWWATCLKNNTDPIVWKQVSAVVGEASVTTWGDITGTLANQTDLQAALDSKTNTVDSVHGRQGAVVAVAGDYEDSEITANATATNYTPTASNVQGHLEGIDTALASSGGGGGGLEYDIFTQELVSYDGGNDEYVIPAATYKGKVKRVNFGSWWFYSYLCYYTTYSSYGGL